MRLAKDCIRRTEKSREEIFEEKKKEFVKVMKRTFTKYIKLKKNQKILEVGCGIGAGVIYLLEKGYDAYGVEPVKESFLLARKHLDEAGLDNKRILQEPAERTHFKEEIFDIIIAKDVLEHVDDIDVSVKESYRILKKGGVLYINSPDFLYPYEAHFKVPYPPLFPKRIVKIYLRLTGHSKKDVEFMDHLKYTTNHNLPRILKKNGFEVFDIHYDKIKGFKKLFYRLFRISLDGKIEICGIKPK